MYVPKMQNDQNSKNFNIQMLGSQHVRFQGVIDTRKAVIGKIKANKKTKIAAATTTKTTTKITTKTTTTTTTKRNNN